MSKTLFWYLFRDLARIFFMASGTLAAIMSFGGLLRPLTENGLDASQVGKMLTYLTPAMMAYSLPAAALFATTVTYGRLAADNELTACRAAGISYTTIGLPAVVLGLGVAILSLVLLCFVVPIFSFKVEKVIYSNLAEVVVNRIARNHQIRFAPPGGTATVVYAQDAEVLPLDPQYPHDQLVKLIGPTIVNYEAPVKGSLLRIPKEFYTAESAVGRIHPAGADPTADPSNMRLDLTYAAKFPRDFTAENQIGMDTATVGPLMLPKPFAENVKFMDIWDLVRLATDPSGSQRVSDVISALLTRDESKAFLEELGSAPNQLRQMTTSASPHQIYSLSTDGPAPTYAKDTLLFTSRPGSRDVKLTITQDERITMTAQAEEATVRARADDADELISATIDLTGVTLQTAAAGPAAGQLPFTTDRAAWSSIIDVPMDDTVKLLRRTRTLAAYVSDPTLDPNDANLIRRNQVVVNNAVRGELHGRASFAVSCLILVLVGCALGMMFKSGNFLTAFAVSFAPALLCITLVVAGQQTADHVPEWIDAKFLLRNQPLRLGLALIWSGNVIVLCMAAYLIAKLRRR